MNKSLFFALSMLVVAGAAYSAAPQAVQEVKKTVETCKCDDKCTAACKCPQCPVLAKSKEAVKAKEAAATQVVANKQAEACAKAKS